jgi:hypothetical protein
MIINEWAGSAQIINTFDPAQFSGTKDDARLHQSNDTADAARLSLNPQFTARFSAIFDQLVSLTKHLEEYDDEDETLVSEHDDIGDSVASFVSPMSHSLACHCRPVLQLWRPRHESHGISRDESIEEMLPWHNVSYSNKLQINTYATGLFKTFSLNDSFRLEAHRVMSHLVRSKERHRYDQAQDLVLPFLQPSPLSKLDIGVLL